VSGGASGIGRPTAKSDSELTTSLRTNFKSQRADASTTDPSQPGTPTSFKSWTSQEEDTLYIPSLDTSSGLAEERSAYDITVKLFYLPKIPASRRCIHTKEAIDLVLKELHVESIDLLIVSFPNIVFDADDESEDESASDPDTTSEGCDGVLGQPEDIPTMLKTWRTIETLHDAGTVSKLGLAEFGTQRLTKFLKEARIRPSVDQINVRDCCVVPRPLIMFAKQERIELLTHSDCTNILPTGTLRELLGPGDKGVGVLTSTTEGVEDELEALKGDVEPQWVIKYTAVVKDRGIVENKGYFAVAELKV
jgi:glutamate--cysteine ligase regulatory subunit